jgi:hydrogenase maturation protease
MPKHWLLIGIGNEYRSDDAVGLWLARKIRDEKLPSVVVKEESGEGTALMEAWQGYQNVIIVDAVESGEKPGTVFRIDAKKESVSVKFFHYSTHAFGVAEALELARTMNTLPQRILLFGIEGKISSAGTNISPIVLKASKQVIEQIIEETKD